MSKELCGKKSIRKYFIRSIKGDIVDRKYEEIEEIRAIV